MRFLVRVGQSSRMRRRIAVAVVACGTFVSPLASSVGFAQAATPTTVAAPVKWTLGTALVPTSGGVNTVSCATSSFCVAADRSGSVATFNGSAWSAPDKVDGTNSFTAISCPTATFCVATDAAGNYVTMNNGVWGAPTPFATANSPVMQGVSCSSASFCLAVGETANFSPIDYYFFNGVWYPDTVVFSPSDTSAFDAVSCTPTLVCLATDLGGGVTTFTFALSPTPSLTHASLPTPISPLTTDYVAQSIACVTATSCVAGSRTNEISVLSGSTWTTSPVFVAGSSGVMVSCAQSTCVANSSLGQGVSAVAPFASWSATGEINMLSQIDGLSCFAVATTVSCLAVDNDGFSIAISLSANGVPTYTAAASSFDPPHTLTSVSCASATYCIASDTAGEIVTYRNGAWSVPTVITTTPLGVREVRCGVSAHPYSALACAAIVGNFRALSLRSYLAAWTPTLSANSLTYSVSCSTRCEYLSPEGRSSGLVHGYLPQLPAGDIATDVSCVAQTTFCMAIDNAGHSYVSKNSKWSLGPAVESFATRQLWALSCASSSFCVAVDIQGHAYVYNGTTWSAGRKVSKLGLYGVSCGATYFCVATDLLGGAFVYDGAKWHATQNVSGFNILHGVSCASANTCVAVDSSHAYSLSIPTDRTRVVFRAPTPGTNVVGRTVIAVSVSAATAPHGTITLSAGTKVNAPSCTASLRKLSTTTSAAHCTIDTSRVGATLFDADFVGSFGFAPSSATPYRELIVAK